MTRLSEQRPAAWVVHKFGGSSVANAACFERVAEILKSQTPGPLGVLSACRGVTDELLRLVTLAESKQDWADTLESLRERHTAIATALLKSGAAAAYVEALDEDLVNLGSILNCVNLVGAAAGTSGTSWQDLGRSGRRGAFRSISRSAKREGEVRWIDARQIVVADPGPLGPSIDYQVSKRNFAGLIGPDFAGTLIITGFIARTSGGAPTTLGRNERFLRFHIRNPVRGLRDPYLDGC